MANTVSGPKSGAFVSGSGTTINVNIDCDPKTVGLIPCDIDFVLWADKAMTVKAQFSPDGGSTWLDASSQETTTASEIYVRTYRVADLKMRVVLITTTTNTTYHYRTIIRALAA